MTKDCDCPEDHLIIPIILPQLKLTY